MRRFLLSGLAAGVLALGGLAGFTGQAQADEHHWHRGWHGNHWHRDWDSHRWHGYRYPVYRNWYGDGYYRPYRSYYYGGYPGYYYDYGYGYFGPRVGVYVVP